MTEKANSLLVWEETDGSERSLIKVTDTDKEPSDVDYERLEICSMNSDSNEMKTDEVIGYVDSITSFSIPEDILD